MQSDAATATHALANRSDTFGEKPQIIKQLADQLTAARAAGVGTTTLQQGLGAHWRAGRAAGLGVSTPLPETLRTGKARAESRHAGGQAALATVLTQLVNCNPASRQERRLTMPDRPVSRLREIVDVLSKTAPRPPRF